MNIAIRTAAEEDCPALAAIDGESNPSPWSAAQFRQALNGRHDTVLLAEFGGTAAGFIVWQTLFDTSELHLIATAPAARRRGIASALMAQWLRTGRENGAEKYILEVRAGNTGAQAFYAKHGFTPTARRRSYYALPGGGREDALIMEKLC